MMKAFKIKWSDTNELTLASYATVEEAIDFGRAICGDFKVVDSATGELMSHFIDEGVSQFGFKDVGGMTYAQVRFNGRE